MTTKPAPPIERVLILKVNSHRHGFAGRICDGAASYDCGAQEDFRLRFCAQGDDRCIHLRAFEAAEPHFYVDHGPGDQAFHGREDAFRGQLILLAAQSNQGGVGIDDGDRRFFATGAYVVDRIREVNFRNRRWWRIDPMDGQWARFLPDVADITRARERAEGIEPSAYVRRARTEDVRRVLHDLTQAHGALQGATLELERDRERALRFLSDVRARFEPEPETARRETTDIGGAIPRRALEQIESKIVARGAAPAKASGGGAVTAFRASSRAGVERAPLPKQPAEQLEAFFKERGFGYPREVLSRFAQSLDAKGFVILAGGPGAGKTAMARLFPQSLAAHGARHLLVPVQPSWRTREDLFGYFNPINDTFVATPFARFLFEAAAAEEEARRAKRAPAPFFVTFDELNLARPEEFLAEILSRTQVEGDDREIEFFPPERQEEIAKRSPVPHLKARVRLPLNLYFVGTMNADGSGYALSPRVLDRAAFIRVDVHLESVLSALAPRHAAASTKEIADTLTHLHETLRRGGRAFGARALTDVLRYVEAAIAAAPPADAETRLRVASDALDVAVLEQVLPALSFSALEQADLAAVDELHGALNGSVEGALCLLRSAGRAETWRQQLQSARDVSGQS